MLDPKALARWIFVALAILSMLAHPQRGYAHPMGNFSISHYAGIRVEPRFIELTYLIDMAEIPTYQELQESGIAARGDDRRLDAYLAQKGALLAEGLSLQVNGRPARLQLISQNAIFPPGAGGLPTMKLGFVYRAAIETFSPDSGFAVHYRDSNFAGRAGWKEIVVTSAAGASLMSSSASNVDRSGQLSNYPTDLIHSPPQDLDATFSFSGPLETVGKSMRGNSVAGSPAGLGGSNFHARTTSAKRLHAAPELQSLGRLPASGVASGGTVSAAVSAPAPLALQANQQATPRSKFTELVSERNLSFWFLLTAAFIAAGLGALHALEPGHGKTIVAAYLVGTRGTPRHAVLLGIIVTATHTAGVYLLGAVTLYASRYIVPERLYPWLGMFSGIMIAGIAFYLLLRAWTGEDGEHSHESGGFHSHWFSALGQRRMMKSPAATSSEDFAGPVRQAPAKVSLKQIIILGVTGGIVPCPAALVVLLSAFSLHRVGFGLFLIVAFSLGLAAVLIIIGLLMVSARQFMARWRTDGPIIKRWLPIASSGCMLILGLGIAVRALLNAGIGSGFLAQGRAISFLGIVLLGLILGMRHSTDPDHVVAVSTIVSRERSIRQGALIGVLWGIGHTLTIFLVGSAIILFGVVIRPRVGLSMEFSVAVMLVLLGVLNLTGVLQWLNAKFTPAVRSRTAEPTGFRAAGGTDGLLDRLIGRYGRYQIFRPLAIGLVHGLAGSAAVALLVLSTIRSPQWGIVYLLVFGLGTIIGMMLMTTAIAIPIAYTGKHYATAGGYLSPISGVISTAFGLFLIYQIGFVDGLFRATVHWTPQ